jgi:hypothetical protein
MRKQRRISKVQLIIAALTPLLLNAAGIAPGAARAAPAGTCEPFTTFAASNFGASTTIDNLFLPLTPGTELTLEGQSATGGAPLPHTVIFTITDVIKPIAGVYTLAIWDRDISDGQLAEEELAFFAQDRNGNVWNLGEYPEEFEGGGFIGAPSTWIAGQAGAVPGVHMPADPRLGSPAYLQGYAPAIKFLDCAQVFAANQRVCVPARCFTSVLVTDETSPISDPGAHQRKYHAPGVGIVQIGAVNDPEGETLVLVKLRRLNPLEMEVARQAALRLDRRAYENSQVYRHTLPATTCIPSPAGAANGLACP